LFIRNIFFTFGNNTIAPEKRSEKKMNDKKQSHEEGRRRYLFGENRFKYPSMPEIEVPNILYPNGLPDPLIGADMQSCDTDPNGMYTGVPAEKSDTPVQDADDL
jgi:hypothetical protein